MDCVKLKKYHGRDLSDFPLMEEGQPQGFCGQDFYKGLDGEVIAVDWGYSVDDFQIVLFDEKGYVDEIVTIGEIAFPNRIHLFDDDTLKKICDKGLRFY